MNETFVILYGIIISITIVTLSVYNNVNERANNRNKYLDYDQIELEFFESELVFNFNN